MILRGDVCAQSLATTTETSIMSVGPVQGSLQLQVETMLSGFLEKYAELYMAILKNVCDSELITPFWPQNQLSSDPNQPNFDLIWEDLQVNDCHIGLVEVDSISYRGWGTLAKFLKSSFADSELQLKTFG